MFYHNERRFATRLVMIAVSLVVALIARTEAQDADTIIREQTTVIERFEPPPRPPSVDVTLTGLPLEQLETVRFRLGSLDLEEAVTLDPAIFASGQDTLSRGTTDCRSTQFQIAGQYRFTELIRQFASTLAASPTAVPSTTVRLPETMALRRR